MATKIAFSVFAALLAIVIIITIGQPIIVTATDSDEDVDLGTTTIEPAEEAQTHIGPCGCPVAVFEPVCASNGRQYATECIFRCLTSGQDDLTVVEPSNCNIMRIHKKFPISNDISII